MIQFLGVVIVLVRIACGIVAGVALAWAARHVAVKWSKPSGMFLAILLAPLALDNLYTSLFLMVSIATPNPDPDPITWSFLFFFGIQGLVAFAAIVFCAYLRGLIGQSTPKEDV